MAIISTQTGRVRKGIWLVIKWYWLYGMGVG